MSTVAFLFLIVIYVAKSDENLKTTCKNDYRHLSDTAIDVMTYCSKNLCIEKCCDAGEIMMKNNTCINVKKWFKIRPKLIHLKPKVNYSINILSSSNENVKLKFDFTLIHNKRNFLKCTAQPNINDVCEYKISRDGSIWWEDIESKKWKQINKLEYCIDYKVIIKNSTPDIKIIIRRVTEIPKEEAEIEELEIPVILISSFFLVLVLVVYCLLPNLRNLSGLVMMAYTFSLLFAFVNKLIITFVKKDPPEGFCKRFTPVVYFGFMSSMFWLNVISFDVWWALRSFRVKRSSKHRELVKFMWYGLFAWGSSLLITAIVTTLDNMPYLVTVEARFKDCFISGKSFDFYYKIPIAILIFFNISLFTMTVYNIWMVKHAVSKCHDSRSSKQQNSKISTFAKLSVMMGLSWCLELLPSIDWLWYYILVNLYNLLIGVAIFYWFVCTKSIFMQLCKKFNIRNRFTKKWELEASQHIKSGITRSTGLASSIVKSRSKEQNPEIDLLKNCPQEESTLV